MGILDGKIPAEHMSSLLPVERKFNIWLGAHGFHLGDNVYLKSNTLEGVIDEIKDSMAHGFGIDRDQCVFTIK